MRKEKKENPEFDRFKEFTKRLVNVPKKEIDEKERELKQKQDCKKGSKNAKVATAKEK